MMKELPKEAGSLQNLLEIIFVTLIIQYQCSCHVNLADISFKLLSTGSYVCETVDLFNMSASNWQCTGVVNLTGELRKLDSMFILLIFADTNYVQFDRLFSQALPRHWDVFTKVNCKFCISIHNRQRSCAVQ
jgi:hypothetical protein